ncbi:MAG: superoxide dismutase (Cu-Zn) [uncultured bacterium]|nr:MAG: superoxide dismutase (Cu-Zn) [uncultured bacterium]
MILKKILQRLVFFTCVFTNCTEAGIIVPMRFVDAEGNGRPLGTFQLDDTLYGLLLTPQLKRLPAGIHGFAVHTLPFCNNYGLAAGGHLDPERTFQHRGPYRGNGHLGDLPILATNAYGKTTLPVLAPRLKLSQVYGHSLVIIAGGDNYSDAPLKEHASKIRIACGIIPYH